MSTTRSVRLWTGAVALAMVTVLAACGSSSGTKNVAANKPTTTSTTAAPTTSTGPPTAAQLSAIGPATASSWTVSLAKGPKGIFLIGPNGHTLYIYTKDQGQVSACTSQACLKAWPPLMSKTKPTSGPAMNSAQVSTTNGQVTYYGHLLYYFAGDTAPNQTNGTSIPDWDLLGPFGNVMLPNP